MLRENLGTERNSFLSGDGSVRPNFNRQLVIVGDLSYAGIFNSVVNFQNGGVNAVDGNRADDISDLLFVAFAGNVTTALVNDDFHIQLCARSQCRDMHPGIQNLDFRVDLDVTSGNFTFALSLDVDGFGCFAVNLGNQTLHVQDDLSDILLDAGNC